MELRISQSNGLFNFFLGWFSLPILAFLKAIRAPSMTEYTTQEKQLLKWTLVVLSLACFTGAAVILKNAFYQGHIQVSGIAGALLVGLIGLLFIYAGFGIEKHLKAHELAKQAGTNGKKFPKGLKVFLVLLPFTVILYFNWSACYNTYYPTFINEEDYIHIEGVLSEDVAYSHASKGSPSLKLRFQEFPDLRFKTRFARSFKHIEKRLSKGDSLTVLLHKNDVAQWITQSQEKDFWNRHNNRGIIEMYGLKDANFVYFDLVTYKELEQKDSRWSIPIAIFLDALALAFTIYFLRRKRKKLTGASPQ